MNQTSNKSHIKKMSKFRGILPLLVDLIAPGVAYFLLHQLGLNDVVALTVSGVAAGLTTALQTARNRKLDGIGLLIVLEIALSIVLMIWTNDPRILLIKPSFYIGAAAIYAWTTCFVGRPLSYETAKPVATKGDPIRMAAYERAWERSGPFRRGERIMTAGWGGFMALEGVLRIVVVFRISEEEIGKSLIVSQLPAIIVLVLAVLFTKRCLTPLKKIVTDYCLEIVREQNH
ncbi:hypothetical protein HPT25_16595 [Bacillus sp. BRMEA1]|uniref:VC0807 family protein n=1 Tax=Neobacillus endophyticus TaxID=2738405 RepID=UPI0015675AAD|nr:VC0807 family protein [Neobacillus endophyticus]NRD78985.1 hypothetical protein [Neobacillus endophyticus]